MASYPEIGLFIGGKWITPPGAKRFTTSNPANGAIVGSFVSGTPKDAEAAVSAAHAAFPQWKATPPPARGDILLRVSQILKERKEQIARVVTQEMGKVIAEGRGDVQELSLIHI